MFPPLAASPPSLAADNNTCPWCLAGLKIQWCKSGPNKEKAFLVCEDIDLHPQRQRFWHWWGVVASRQARASLSLSPTLNLANTSFSFPSTAPPASSSAVGMTSTQTPALRCRYVSGCQSTRVAPLCKSRCCKKHCIMLNNGSCPLKTHDPATMSQRQRRDANVPPPLPARRRQTLFSPPPVASPPKSPVDGFSPSFLSALDGIAQQQSFGWDYGPVLQQARIDSPSIYLDQALHTGRSPLSPSLPSSQDAADREDEELQLALTLSLALSSSTSASTSSSSPSSSQAAPPPSQPRVPASSVARKTTLPKPPRITTQLNPAWMLQATGTRPANDTFAVRQPVLGQGRQAAAHCGVTECPSWPEFRLSDSTRTLDLLGSDLAAVEFYNVRFCLWTRVDLTFTHILTSDTYLPSAASHIRYNVAAERVAVHNKIKARQTQETDNDAADDDLEISPIADANIVEVMDSPPPRMERPSLRIVTSGAGAAVANPICLDDDITPSSTTSSSSALFSAFSSSSPSTTPPASPFVWPSDLDVPQSSSTTSGMSATSRAPLKWPAGMYTVNVAQGFLRMEAADMQHIPLAERFQRVFKTSSEFRQRTYTDARLRWTRGSESLRTAALDAGRTKAGLWSLYAAQVPLKK
ncbi:hypothetical protein B0H13DRAFT_2323371 [Mycena leptocephala]|nr:hypothetical protein B0H13DRAFT_2323371 [Mycena leptocephala]